MTSRRGPTKPIFLIGSPKSGKTTMAKYFSQHPDVVYCAEQGSLWDPLQYHEPDADHCWTAERATPSEVQRIVDAFQAICRRHGVSRFVNDHARNSVRIGYLRRIFPDALFLHVVHDPRRVVLAILSKAVRDPWRQAVPMLGYCKPPEWRTMVSDDVVAQTARQWVGIVTYVRQWQAELGDALLEAHFDQFCQNPRRELTRAYEWAGLPILGNVLERLPARVIPRGDLLPEHLPPVCRATIETVTGPLLRQLGYNGERYS
ncbi:MAG: sulfotransferase [Candidatus Omnitrophota bacterium]|nr:sulfotransferase [Candidatus Omnitrophota bacterium]